MRYGAYRVFGYALLASLLAHGLVLFALPAARELSALVRPEPEPLIARVEHVAPPPAPPAAPPPAAMPEARKPVPAAPLQVFRPAAPVAAPSVEPAAPTPAPVQQSPTPAPVAAAPVPPAPALGPPIDPAVRTDYARRINEAAERFKVYPRVAIDNGWRGEVALAMAIGADGRIASLRVSRSSGHKVLDDQAMQMFARAKPRVPVPPTLRGRAFELELRAVFQLDGRS